MIALITIVLIGLLHSGNTQLCERKLKQQNLIPDVIRSCDYDLEVVYNGDRKMNCGGYFSFTETTKSPVIRLPVLKKCKYVTLVMFDPDMSVLEGFVHWLAFNIPSSSMEKGWKTGSKGDTRFPYVPPIAPLDTHRYVFLLFCQKDKVIVEPANKEESAAKRMFFNVTEFQQKHKFHNPLACNFMDVILA